jgi:branched-chain amino acid transport system substrate-binding protein
MGLSYLRLGVACAAALAVPLTARAADPIKIGFPMPLSGPAAVYGVPVTKGAQMAVEEINAKGGILGRKLELLSRDSKANADEAVRLARELIIKDNADFLSGTLTSAEAPAVSTIAKENKVVFIAPVAKTMKLTAPENLHPYVFRIASNTLIEGRQMAATVSKWDIKTVGTIAPDYAYGRDAVAAFSEYLKKLKPEIQIVDQQWPKLGEPDFTPFITAQMSKKPEAIMCDVFGGDFVTFAKQAAPLGYFKAINNRLIDGGEVGTIDAAQALGGDYPYGITSDTYDPVVWAGGNEPPEHKAYVERLKAFMKSEYGSGWAIQGYSAIQALAAAIQKAGSVDNEKVAAALLGLTFDTPGGKRTIDAKTHETQAGEFWGEMVKDAAYPFAVMKNPAYQDPQPLMN